MPATPGLPLVPAVPVLEHVYADPLQVTTLFEGTGEKAEIGVEVGGVPVPVHSHVPSGYGEVAPLYG